MFFPSIWTTSISPCMNVYYISKHKKLCGDEQGLCLSWIESGSRVWQSIDSEARSGWKAWYLGMKKIASPPIIQHILPLDELCRDQKRLRLLWIEGVRRGCQSVDSEAGKGFLVGDERNCLSPHFFPPSSPWLNCARWVRAPTLMNRGSEEGLTKHWVLGRGSIKGLSVGDEETFSPSTSPSLLSPWMNVFYISKHKKLCGDE